MKNIAPLCLLLMLPTAWAQEMNRCTVGGKVVIQEAPCASGPKSADRVRAEVAANHLANAPARNINQVLAEGKPLVIPSDASATWVVLEKTGAPADELHTITTKRSGPSGVSWSKREYNCLRWTVRYLGTGSTPEQMRASAADARPAPITQGSIADHLGREACRNYDIAPFGAGGKGNG